MELEEEEDYEIDISTQEVESVVDYHEYELERKNSELALENESSVGFREKLGFEERATPMKKLIKDREKEDAIYALMRATNFTDEFLMYWMNMYLTENGLNKPHLQPQELDTYNTVTQIFSAVLNDDDFNTREMFVYQLLNTHESMRIQYINDTKIKNAAYHFFGDCHSYNIGEVQQSQVLEELSGIHNKNSPELRKLQFGILKDILARYGFIENLSWRECVEIMLTNYLAITQLTPDKLDELYGELE